MKHSNPLAGWGGGVVGLVVAFSLSWTVPPAELLLPAGDLYRYTVQRVAIDTVDVYAPSAREARRMVEAWDRTWPHHREARPLQQTGVAWKEESYAAHVIEKGGVLVVDEAQLDREEGEGSDAP